MLMELRGSREEMGICKRNVGLIEMDWKRTGGHCFPFDTEIGEFRATYGTRAGLQAAYGDYYRKKLDFIILF